MVEWQQLSIQLLTIRFPSSLPGPRKPEATRKAPSFTFEKPAWIRQEDEAGPIVCLLLTLLGRILIGVGRIRYFFANSLSLSPPTRRLKDRCKWNGNHEKMSSIISHLFVSQFHPCISAIYPINNLFKHPSTHLHLLSYPFIYPSIHSVLPSFLLSCFYSLIHSSVYLVLIHSNFVAQSLIHIHTLIHFAFRKVIFHFFHLITHSSI